MKFFVVALLISLVLGDCPSPPKDPVECTGSDLMCGGEPDSEGCPMPMWCMFVDPYARCSARDACQLHVQKIRCHVLEDQIQKAVQ